MIRLGIVDFDTSHVVAFTQRLNHIGVSQDQWVDGAKVVVGCPGESLLSPERIPGFTKQIQEYEVQLVDKPEEIIGLVDGVLIASVDGSVHYERTVPFLEAGLPVFVDKPFTCTLEEATGSSAVCSIKKHRHFFFFSVAFTLWRLSKSRKKNTKLARLLA